MFILFLLMVRKIPIMPSTVLEMLGAPVAQWVKRWPTDLAVTSSSPARGEDLLNRTRDSIAQVFHYHPPIVVI